VLGRAVVIAIGLPIGPTAPPTEARSSFGVITQASQRVGSGAASGIATPVGLWWLQALLESKASVKGNC